MVHGHIDWAKILATASLGAWLVGCTGHLSAPGGNTSNASPGASEATSGTAGSPGAASGGAGSVAPSAQPMQRLNRRELVNTVREIFGGQAQISTKGLAEELSTATGFPAPPTISTPEARALLQNLESVVEGPIGVTARLAACAEAQASNCVKPMLADFGRSAFRRPLSAIELDELVAGYDSARLGGLTHADGLAAVLEATLMSPAFLYRWELGQERLEPTNGLVALTPHQRASRLAYFLWDAPPDAILAAEADAGRLTTPEQLRAQAERMLADKERVSEVLLDFHRYWLGLNKLAEAPKSAALYPVWSATSAATAVAEVRALLRGVILDGDGSLHTLFTTQNLYTNQTFASVYGAGTQAVSLEPFASNMAQRRGVLTTVAFLAATGDTAGSFPPRRGDVLYRHVLCGQLATVPNDIPKVEPPAPNVTTRERFEKHREAGSACMGCHQVLDPLGFAFEHYGGIGEWRDLDMGKAIDSSGAVTLPSGTRVTFNNALELIDALATSPDLASCATTKWLRYALGRMEVEGDDVEGLRAKFAAANYDVRRMLVDVAVSRSFTHRALSQGESL